MSNLGLRDIVITFIGGPYIKVPECTPEIADKLVSEIVSILRNDASDPIYTIIRPLDGPQIFDVRKIVSIEVIGGPGIGRRASKTN